MALVPRRPLWDLERFFDEWPVRLGFELTDVSKRTPLMDIYETNGEVVAEVELPGVNAKDVDVEITDNILKVEAKAEEKKERKQKGYYQKELCKGYYKRVVSLPVAVDDKKAKASYEDGVLKIVIPKKKIKKTEAKKGIKVKVKKIEKSK